MVFMPKDDELRERCRAAFEGTLAASGMKLLCWRKVPTCNAEIGHTAKMAEVRGRYRFRELSLPAGSPLQLTPRALLQPVIEQIFLATEQPPAAGECTPLIRLAPLRCRFALPDLNG